MLVSKIMSKNVVTVSAEAGVQDALALMKEHDIRHLPVLDRKQGRLIGLVTDRDVRGAIVPAMLEDITVQDLMISNPITVNPEAMLEDAARVVYHHKIGCLPVVDENGGLAGIVTVADMLAALIEVMGFLSSSSRLDVVLPERAESLEEACRIIHKNGGRIIGVSLTRMGEEELVHLFRLQKTDLSPIVEQMTEAGYSVVSSLS